MVEREVHARLEHEALVDPRPVRHLEVAALGAAVIEYPVPRIRLCAHIMDIRRAEVDEVYLRRTLRLRVDEEIVLHRFTPVDHYVGNSVRSDVQVS